MAGRICWHLLHHSVLDKQTPSVLRGWGLSWEGRGIGTNRGSESDKLKVRSAI